ncbi:protein FAR1-RELATED SEQUENCE 5-like [Silene latifolia]|uniref:protein FAR1-RELATED SEQUENCE 5-like n=1 Tax=Silene latifolia TaxID=37657 RepID=UPI003D77DCEA
MKVIEGGDASTLMTLLASRQAEDPGFFFRVQFGKDGRYNLICGAFVGINNHWSNVMFGFAFLANEKQESFEWLFNVFNESMGTDTVPVTIFTDQDLAMKNAIDEVYKTSRHRLCQWHIQQNAISHFGLLKHDRVFQNAFNKCLNGCYSEVEFETTWRKMISEYGLQNNEWFKRLYGLKEMWSTALNKEYFSAGILSSQRSESTNHAMGFQATKTTSLTDFYHIYEGTVKRWRDEEERKEFNCIRSTPTSVYPLVDLLQHASQVYTIELFRLFEKEFVVAMGTRAVILSTENSVLLYGVDPPGVSGSTHHVTFDCVNNMVECSCRKFQEMGMLCFHILRVFHMHSVNEIPTRYILRRWTKFAKREVWSRILPNDMRRAVANGALNWRRGVMTKLYNLIAKCQNDPDARGVVDKLYSTANDEVQQLFKDKMSSEPEPVVDATAVLDPIRSVTKGRSKRKPSSVAKKKRSKKGSNNVASNAELYTPVPRLI